MPPYSPSLGSAKGCSQGMLCCAEHTGVHLLVGALSTPLYTLGTPCSYGCSKGSQPSTELGAARGPPLPSSWLCTATCETWWDQWSIRLLLECACGPWQP